MHNHRTLRLTRPSPFSFAKYIGIIIGTDCHNHRPAGKVGDVARAPWIRGQKPAQL
jgi:hypothetical protein